MTQSSLTSPKKTRQGLIMVYVIVVMLLTSLMGLIIMVSTQSEVTSSGRQSRSKAAFNSADSTAKLANLFALILMHPVLDSPSKLLSSTGSPNQELTVVFNEGRFTMESLFDESKPTEFHKRYLQTGLTNSPTAPAPHITFKIGDKVVARSVVSLDISASNQAGLSLGVSGLYDKTSGLNVPVDLVVTTRGNNSTGDDDDITTPQSLITTIMREFF
ncbi:MAG: hypothetical protein LBR11_07580 [Deltaproteobacteria bacterium]|nr:hypothetical protein [Deltaproteobacteria bacterium]